MAVVIRLKRTGRSKRPCYRISVADSRSPRDGRTLETLGIYDPVVPDAEKQATLKVDRARHWMSEGALPSETVHSIFRRMGVYEGEFAPTHKPRKRPGRKKVTKKREARNAAKAERGARKTARQTARAEAKAAARKAAKAEEASGDE